MANPRPEPTFIKIVITRDVHERIKAFNANWEGVETKEVTVVVQLGEGQQHEATMTLTEFLEKLSLGVAAKIIKADVPR